MCGLSATLVLCLLAAPAGSLEGQPSSRPADQPVETRPAVERALTDLRSWRDPAALLAGEPLDGPAALAQASQPAAQAEREQATQRLRLSWENYAWTRHLVRASSALAVEVAPPMASDLEDPSAVRRALLASAEAMGRANDVSVAPPSQSRHRFGWHDDGPALGSDVGLWEFSLAGAGGAEPVEARVGACLYRRWTTPAGATALLASALSPGAYVLTDAGALTLRDWQARQATPPNCLALAVDGQVHTFDLNQAGTAYDADRDGPMSAAWMLLWHNVRGPRNPRPLLILVDGPAARVVVDQPADGPRAVRVEMPCSADGKAFHRFALVRPFGPLANLLAELTRLEVEIVQKWAAALRAYPVEFTELSADTPAGAELTYVYGYAEIADAFNTRPARLAPLPPSLVPRQPPSAAQSAKAVELLAGEDGGYWVVPGVDRVTVVLPAEPATQATRPEGP